MEVRIRARRPDDVPELARLLEAQQPDSRYPIRWPLPMPVERFLVRTTELEAWVAEVDGVLAGHVSTAWVDDDLAALFAPGPGAGTPLGMVSVLFTAQTHRGLGVGDRLLQVAVDWIRGQGRVPVLDVVPTHDAALALYRRRGWVEVARDRFPWMNGDVPDVLLLALPPYPPSASSTEA